MHIKVTGRVFFHFLSLSSQRFYKQYDSGRQKTIYRDIRLPDERG